jgi:hypothetical protein
LNVKEDQAELIRSVIKNVDTKLENVRLMHAKTGVAIEELLNKFSGHKKS